MFRSTTTTAVLTGIALLSLGGCVERHERSDDPPGSEETGLSAGSGARTSEPPMSTDAAVAEADAGRRPEPGAEAGPEPEPVPGLERLESSVRIGSRFRPCSADADCVLVGTDCNGCCGQDAIAEALRASYEMAHAQLCADYQGAICDCSNLPLEPRCVDAQCAAVLQEEPEPADPHALTRDDDDVMVGEAYLACTQDSDCTLVASTCSDCCQWNAINASLVDTYRTNFVLACEGYQGGSCDCEPQPAEANCVDERCVVTSTTTDA